MKLPGGDNAIVEIAKLRDYCLDPQHPRGRHKARVFAATLGLAQIDAEFLRESLLLAAREADALVGESDEYGDRFTVDFELNRGNQRAVVRSAADTRPVHLGTVATFIVFRIRFLLGSRGEHPVNQSRC